MFTKTNSIARDSGIRKKRIWEIDFLRGLAIFLMIFDHIAYDFANFSQFFPGADFFGTGNRAFYDFIIFCRNFEVSDLRMILHYIFSNLFFFLVGISCCFSKNNFKRGFLILLGGVIIDGASYALYYISGTTIDLRMIFNVLVCIGLCILIVGLLIKFVNPRYAKWISLALGIITISCGLGFNLYRSVWIYEISWADIPYILVGLRSFGSDCFPLIPYIGSVFIGIFVGQMFYSERKSLLPSLDKAWNRPLCYLGRHTMWVYFIHQPVAIAALLIIGLSLGFQLG